MKITLLTLATTIALTGTVFAAEGERPEPQDNRRPYYGLSNDPPRDPNLYVEPSEGLRKPRL